ncbi:MAG: zf-TFIIB domain-containing protein [Planctomycetes bacterium]|nr:zf-TFIIB domain-containing protein [Planctomycetota bacterium]
MDCPKCDGAQLEAIEVDEVEVDRCGACAGIWFDPSELGRLLDDDTQKVGAIMTGDDDGGHDQRVASCPRDGTRLVRVRSIRNSAIVIDTCTKCRGIWLDGGEFRRIKREQPGVKLGELV